MGLKDAIIRLIKQKKPIRDRKKTRPGTSLKQRTATFAASNQIRKTLEEVVIILSMSRDTTLNGSTEGLQQYKPLATLKNKKARLDISSKCLKEGGKKTLFGQMKQD